VPPYAKEVFFSRVSVTLLAAGWIDILAHIPPLWLPGPSMRLAGGVSATTAVPWPHCCKQMDRLRCWFLT
jgi:hypothetical protein